MDKKEQTLFQRLKAIDVGAHIEKKKTGTRELSYLSWTWAWSTFKEECPDANYEIKRDTSGNMFRFTPGIGAFVETSITANGETYTMWLPVLDSANNPMKENPYDYTTSKGTQVHVDAIDSFAINTAIMRCLVKNMAMFGLGLYIYAGEDLPPEPFEPMTDVQKTRLEELGVEDWPAVCTFLKVKDIKEISSKHAETLINAKIQQIKRNNG